MPISQAKLLPDPEITIPKGESADAPPLALTEIFGRQAPREIEIGSGNGLYRAAEAEAHPDRDFIGIERCKEFFTKFKKRVVRQGLANVRCLCADANEVFARSVAPESIDRVVCNFSDPWPKRRHRSRRVFQPAFIDLIERALKIGGGISFKTDVGWYFNLTIAEFRRRPAWRILEAGPVGIDGEGGTVTNFERKAREVGSEVWAFQAGWYPSFTENKRG